MKIGGNANAPVRYVTADPDGVLIAPRGTLAVNTLTGVQYRSRGGTLWDADIIPPKYGTSHFHDFFDTLPITGSGIGGGSGSLGGESASPGYFGQSVSAAGVDAHVLRFNTATWIGGGGAFSFRARVRVPTISDGANNIVCRIGPGDATTFADHVDGIYFEYDFATHGDHVWRICAANNSVRTKTTTGIALVANTWTELELRLNAGGTSLVGYVNEVAAPTPVTTNIPTGVRATSPACAMALKQLGAGALSMHTDWWGFTQVLSSVR